MIKRNDSVTLYSIPQTSMLKSTISKILSLAQLHKDNIVYDVNKGQVCTRYDALVTQFHSCCNVTQNQIKTS